MTVTLVIIGDGGMHEAGISDAKFDRPKGKRSKLALSDFSQGLSVGASICANSCLNVLIPLSVAVRHKASGLGMYLSVYEVIMSFLIAFL